MGVDDKAPASDTRQADKGLDAEAGLHRCAAGCLSLGLCCGNAGVGKQTGQTGTGTCGGAASELAGGGQHAELDKLWQ